MEADLKTLLGNADYATVRDRIYQRALGKLVKFRAWLIGGVYTSGSMALIHDGEGGILLVKPWYRQGWGLPGGMMKRREQSIDTLRREIREELGVEIDEALRYDVYVQRRRRHIDHLYVARLARQTKLNTGRLGEIAEVEWFQADRLPDLQKEAVEALERLRKNRRDDR
jgi:8-oxo-dGTP pyrophosphatase MutT (NUDIX family)